MNVGAARKFDKHKLGTDLEIVGTFIGFQRLAPALLTALYVQPDKTHESWEYL